jgi:CRISPR-associated endoribonuclease Cas6
MKIRIQVSFDSPIKIPMANNHILQSYLYSKMSPETRNRVHEEGYRYGKLPFRLFNFSRLLGKYQAEKHHICFDAFSIQISSPIESLIQEIASSILIKSNILAGQPVNVCSLEVIPFKKTDVIKMLSPLVIAKNVGKRTEYTSPWDENFNELVNNNLRKKYFLVHGKEYSGEGITLTSTSQYNTHLKQVVKYKNSLHTAWNGYFIVDGDEELLQIAFTTGIGQKSSQGFGMFQFM